MSDERQELRLAIWQAYREWDTEQAALVVRCMWCGKLITGMDFHAHEWLVKRSAVNPEQQDLIFVPENVIPVHPGCHDEHGQKREATRRALEHAARLIRADRIGQWYVSLWQKHGLSVPKGLFIEPHEIPLYGAVFIFMEGARLLSREPLPDSWKHPADPAIDVRDCAFAQFVPEKKAIHRELAAKLPDTFANIRRQVLVEWARQGFWLHYLKGVVG